VDQSVSATVSEEPGGFGRPGSGITESVVEGWEDEGPATRKRGGRLKWWLAGGAALLAAAGAVIAVLLFTGLLAGKETRVPNLINLPAGQADKALAEAHLKKGKVTEGFSFDIWKDKIMKQMPSAGTKVTRDSTVDMVVSMGNDVVQVPEVLNMPEAEAEQTLKVFGFNVKKESAYRAGVPVGYVFEARPAPGAIKPRGTEVTLVVNTGQPAVKKPAGNQKKPAVSAPLP
jgi:beta-lactam-binding protein with PASTA domain